MTVGEMLQKMSSDELSYWKAYSALEHEEVEWEKKKVRPKGR